MTDVTTTAPPSEIPPEETPPAAPSVETPPAETETLQDGFSEEEVNELLGEDGSEEEGPTPPSEETPPAEEPPPTEPVPVEGEVPPVEPVVPPTETPPTEAVKPPETPPETPPPEPTTAPVEPVDFDAQRQLAVDELTKTYAMSEDDAETLLEKPEEILPGMLAKLHTDVYTQVISSVIGSMPDMVQGLMDQNSSIKNAEAQFYEAFPILNKPEYVATVNQVMSMYRQMHPEFNLGGDLAIPIQEIGRHASFMLRLELPPPSGQEPPAPPIVPPPQPPPHVPALPGASSAGPPAPVKVNPWGDMVEEFEKIGD